MKFGASIAIGGEVIVVGDYTDTDPPLSNSRQCAAFIYRFDGAEWVEEQKLTAFDDAPWGYFEISVSLSGSTVLVGANDGRRGYQLGPGAAYVFRYNGSNWVEQTKLTATDGAVGDEFGVSASPRTGPFGPTCQND